MAPILMSMEPASLIVPIISMPTAAFTLAIVFALVVNSEMLLIISVWCSVRLDTSVILQEATYAEKHVQLLHNTEILSAGYASLKPIAPLPISMLTITLASASHSVLKVRTLMAMQSTTSALLTVPGQEEAITSKIHQLKIVCRTVLLIHLLLQTTAPRCVWRCVQALSSQ